MLCERCNENEPTVFITKVIHGGMTKRNLCEECDKVENPEGFDHTCFYCGEKLVNAVLCPLCQAELFRFMHSKGLIFPTDHPTPEQVAEIKAMEAELEKHMKNWVAQRKRD